MYNPEIAEENHEEKLREIANGFQPDDAKIVLDIFVQKFPDLVFKSLYERFKEMTQNGMSVKDMLNHTYGVYGTGGSNDF